VKSTFGSPLRAGPPQRKKAAKVNREKVAKKDVSIQLNWGGEANKGKRGGGVESEGKLMRPPILTQKGKIKRED